MTGKIAMGVAIVIRLPRPESARIAAGTVVLAFGISRLLLAVPGDHDGYLRRR